MEQKIYFKSVNVRKYLRENKKEMGGCYCHESKCPVGGVLYGTAQSN